MTKKSVGKIAESIHRCSLHLDIQRVDYLVRHCDRWRRNLLASRPRMQITLRDMQPYFGVLKIDHVSQLYKSIGYHQ